MKVPTKLKFLGYTYDIEVGIQQVFTDQTLSKTCTYEQKIWVHEGASEERKLQLFFCEAIAIIKSMTGMELEEEHRFRMSHGLAGMLLNNDIFNPDKYPEQINFLGYTYTIHTEMENTSHDCSFGYIEFLRQNIYIHEAATATRRYETLLHELVHLIDYTFKLELEEEQVVCLSHNLFGLLVENKMIPANFEPKKNKKG